MIWKKKIAFLLQSRTCIWYNTGCNDDRLECIDPLTIWPSDNVASLVAFSSFFLFTFLLLSFFSLLGKWYKGIPLFCARFARPFTSSNNKYRLHDVLSLFPISLYNLELARVHTRNRATERSAFTSILWLHFSWRYVQALSMLLVYEKREYNVFI